MLAAYAINWTEYERGWGTRPDGHTLHATKEIAQKYRSDFLSKRPGGNYVPDEYSQPGDPFLTEVDEATHAELQEKGSKWGHHSRWLSER